MVHTKQTLRKSGGEGPVPTAVIKAPRKEPPNLMKSLIDIDQAQWHCEK